MRAGRWGSAERAHPVNPVHPLHAIRPSSTGLTLASTAALAIGLSLAPIPEALRPFPGLRSEPLATARAALFPRAPGAPASPLAPGQETAVVLAPTTEPGSSLPSEPEALEMALLVEQSREAIDSLPEGARKSAEALEALGTAVSTHPIDIEEGCRRQGPEGCEERALDPFFGALAAVRAGRRNEPVRVVHLGDSLIASDYITGMVRERLQARHGEAGTGFLFVDRPMLTSGLYTRTGRATRGWEVERLTDDVRTSALGFTGVLFASAQAPLTSSFDARGARVADVLYLGQPGGGELEVRADGQLLKELRTQKPTARPEFARLSLPRESKRVSLSTRGKVGVYGVALETKAPGVVYDSIGLPGATAGVLLRADEAAFKEQLAQREPSLVVVMLGGNEAFDFSRGKLDEAGATRAFTGLVRRVHDAAPAAACLLVGPMAAGVRALNGVLSPRKGTRTAADVVRSVALENGCAFWDMLEAMGGDAALGPWLARRLLMEDYVHPRKLGGDLLGHLFDLALERARLERTEVSSAADPTVRGQPLEPERLRRVFARLDALAAGQASRVGMMQLGASHTAAHFFTDQVRRRLAARFGDAGRGYIAVGRPSKRLESSGVRRSLQGSWQVRDALAHTDPSGSWSLTGVRADGRANAGLSFDFCLGCADAPVRSKLQLFYLEQPNMGQLEVSLDGSEVALIPTPPEPSEPSGPPERPEVRVLSFDAPGPRHRLAISNRGPGEVSVLAAASELERPGIVYDAAGLPGSTIFTLAGYGAGVLEAQLKARAPDLYVLFYGTNESAVSQLDLTAMREAYRLVFRRLKEASPEADCLLIGPTDRMRRQSDDVWVESPSQDKVIEALGQLADEEGCAFWSARAAMGGPRSMTAWLSQRPRLAHPDHVHLSPPGYVRLADAFVDDLLGAYDARSRADR